MSGAPGTQAVGASCPVLSWYLSRSGGMADQRERIGFAGRMVIVGFGSIGQGVLPLLLRHLDLEPSRIVIVTADERGREEAEQYGIAFFDELLTRDNYRHILEPLLGPGDFLLNVSVDVSSVSLMELCAEQGALYLDTCIEPWVGGYTDSSLSASKRSNYALRESALELGKRLGASAPTAILTHGANPGLVSHFVKQALLDIARDTGVKLRGVPKTREEWARLAQRLSVKVIHISERDTQVANQPKEIGEFVNTWSIEGFVSEGSQPSELGWGTHERHFPEDAGRHDFGGGAAIYLNRPGAGTRVRSWTPLEGPFHGFLITHGEAISNFRPTSPSKRTDARSIGPRCTMPITRAMTPCFPSTNLPERTGICRNAADC